MSQRELSIKGLFILLFPIPLVTIFVFTNHALVFLTMEGILFINVGVILGLSLKKDIPMWCNFLFQTPVNNKTPNK